MFGLFKLFKRKRTQPETNSTPPPMTHWGLSEEEQLLDQISEYTYWTARASEG